MQIVFAGTAAESPAIEALRSGLSFPTATVAGQTSLLELSAILGLADIALTLDTGPMHLARAMRLPMVIIAPAWSPAVEWLPLNNPRARILKNLDLPTPPPDDYLIDEVTVPEVEQHLNELLPSTHPAPSPTALSSYSAPAQLSHPERSATRAAEGPATSSAAALIPAPSPDVPPS